MSDLRKEHKEFDAMKGRWALCRAASDGEHAIHAAKETYLPRLNEEDDTAYNLRLKMTPWFNASWRTISGMGGMLFSKPPIIEFPKSMKDHLEDIDCAGTTMAGLAREVAEEALTVGRIGLLVDYPPSPTGATQADAKALKLRPMISIYKAESIYNWKESRVGGVTQPVQVRLVEQAEIESEDEFSQSTEKRYRVLDLFQGKYRQRVYRITEKGDEEQVGEDVFPMMNNKAMDFIPFVFIGVDCVGPDVDVPPLMDLITTNLHHYLQATSYERGCFFSGLPTMFVSGMDDDDDVISIGGSMANSLRNANAKAYYVEVASKFEALRTNLEDKKREMAVLGARMLEGQKAQTEAAETLARRQSGEESVLSSMSQTISQGLTRALGWVALWAGSTEKVAYELNKDFTPTTLTSADITSLIAAWQAGAISQETLFNNLQHGEIIDEDTTYAIEQERIASAQPSLSTPELTLPPV